MIAKHLSKIKRDGTHVGAYLENNPGPHRWKSHICQTTWAVVTGAAITLGTLGIKMWTVQLHFCMKVLRLVHLSTYHHVSCSSPLFLFHLDSSCYSRSSGHQWQKAGLSQKKNSMFEHSNLSHACSLRLLSTAYQTVPVFHSHRLVFEHQPCWCGGWGHVWGWCSRPLKPWRYWESWRRLWICWSRHGLQVKPSWGRMVSGS